MRCVEGDQRPDFNKTYLPYLTWDAETKRESLAADFEATREH